MSKRLQVILDDKEFADIQQSARRHRMTTAEWVRQALRAVRRAEPQGDVKKKLDVVRAAVRHEFPTADIDRMLNEIERGYTARPAR
ncbi:MAG TPA: antitoxin [Candidatus Binatia bacterium]|nr:antitoxin [Candidatus Binatia bacterium]